MQINHLLFSSRAYFLQRSQRRRPQGPKEHRWRGPRPGCATHAQMSLEALMLSIFISWCSAWPKNDYIKTPLGDPERRRRRNMKHRNKICSNKDWRGKRYRRRFGRFSNINTIDTAMEREQSTSRLWVCGSSLIYLSLMIQCLDATWAAQHDYGVYYVIPMWWIFILLDDL
jgi:hypothetical protein